MAGNLIKRYIWLLNVIDNAGAASFDYISAKWESCSLNDDGVPLSRQTFHNHVRSIQELFGVRIACDRRNECKYYIENKAGNSNGQFQDVLLDMLFAYNELGYDSSLREKVIIPPYLSAPKFRLFVQAIKEHRKVRMVRYLSPGGNGNNDFSIDVEIEPYCLSSVGRHWYVIGRERDILGWYGISFHQLCRIGNEVLTDSFFDYPADFNADVFLKNWRYDVNKSLNDDSEAYAVDSGQGTYEYYMDELVKKYERLARKVEEAKLKKGTKT